MKTELKTPLPGKEIQYQMAPTDRDLRYVPSLGQEPPIKAAVLILLFPENGNISTVFIKRTRYPGPHSGQISFPGGKFEPNDKQLYKTALRETCEELGVNTKDVKKLGSLTPLYIGVSNFNVFPYVGYIGTELNFRIQKEEVEHTITENLSTLLNQNNKGKTRIKKNGFDITAPCFHIGESKVWGATAMILNEFLSICKKIELI
ncbi:MAG: CoA pyrophosphatase [Bacteroidales bacterium]|nr:CoA pyrophosphatase [Bacteroidales bacterium]